MLSTFAVVPVLTGPLQVLLAILPGLLVGFFTVLVSLFRPSVMKQGLQLLWRLKLPIAAIAVVGVSSVWAVRAIWPSGAGTVAQERDAKSWPVFRGSLDRRGALPDAVGPTRGGINWSWKQGNAAFFSSPAIVGNLVYVATAELGAFSQAGNICCFDAAAGKLLWSSAPPGYRPTFSSPAVSGNYLVCGEGLHDSTDARIVCLDLTPKNEGKVLWTFATKSHVECTPVIDNDRLYVGAGDDGYYCLDLKAEANGKGRVIWHVEGKNYPDAETSLAVFDGKVYAGLGNGGKALCVLDAKTGKELHRLDMPYPVFGPPAIADGKLYIGMGNGDYVHSADEVRDIQLERLKERGANKSELDKAFRDLAPGGEVCCIDLATLMIDWKYRVDQTVLGAIAVMPDALYFGSRDGYLYTLDRAGQLQGRWNARSPIIASPAVTGHHVYFVTNGGTLYGLDRHSLEPVWEFRVGTQPLFISSPAVGRGRVFIGTQADGFLSVGEPGERETPAWPAFLGGPGAAGNIDGSAIPTLPDIRWQFPAEDNPKTPVAVLDGSIYLPLPETSRGLVCLPPTAAPNMPPEPRWIFPTRHGVYQSPALHGDNLFFVDGKPWDYDGKLPDEDCRHLHCIDASRTLPSPLGGEGRVRGGKLRWMAAVDNKATGVLCVDADAVYVQDTASGLSRFAHGGIKPAWTRDIGRLEHPPCVANWIVLAAVADPPALVALDRGTGAELWRQPLKHKPTAMPVVSRTTIYLGSADGLEARSLIDGKMLPGWRPTKGSVSSEIAMRRSELAYVSNQGELIVVERESGKELERIGGALPGFAPLVSRDTILFLARVESGKKETTNIMQLVRGKQSDLSVWMDGETLGRVITPLVLADSQVYVGVAGKGLVQLGAAP